ncbi:hypothetical protein RI103_00305 [Paraburkholderia sp. FT54]|uniref:hypothetical protein n=1 Tax=Paraburkholderia sp. FT54 TaxID=3074437 RepID=UPI00287725AC|nr:hypothetical protein [Paraburkholderia sp. FT54]WNC89838.1 hypothetical protein RI103_00305 [Paraburkholderia sp. FT54]
MVRIAQCGKVAAVPAQSTPAVREARRKEVWPIEAQLPAIYLDVLDLAAYMVDSASSTEFRKVLMILYLHRFASGEFPRAGLIRAHLATSERFRERRGEARRRFSMKVPPRIVEDLKTLMPDTILTQTEVIKSVIYQFHADVVESRNPELIRKLGVLSVVYA